jgi:sugar lactone lactonase YvrE
LPASAVQSALGLATPLTATPDTDGGNGCDYKGAAPGPIVVMADTSDSSGIVGTMFNQQLTKLGPNATLLSGVGEAAYYSESHHQQIPRYPGVAFSKQDLAFRAKGKIVSFVCTFRGNGVPKSAAIALAQLALSKPINTLKDQ